MEARLRFPQEPEFQLLYATNLLVFRRDEVASLGSWPLAEVVDDALPRMRKKDYLEDLRRKLVTAAESKPEP